MSSIEPIDFPDWNPPRDRVIGRQNLEIVESIPAGEQADFGFGAGTFDNVLTVAVELEADTAVSASSLTPDGFDVSPVLQISLGGGLQTMIPLLHRGNGIDVTFFNGTGSLWTPDVAIDGYAGVTADIIIPGRADAQFTNLPVVAMADSAVVDVPNAQAYDRCIVQATCDQAYTVTVLRPYIVPGTPLTVEAFSETIITEVSGGDATLVDIPIGGPGLAFKFTSTSITDGTAQLFTRCYRAAGY